MFVKNVGHLLLSLSGGTAGFLNTKALAQEWTVNTKDFHHFHPCYNTMTIDDRDESSVSREKREARAGLVAGKSRNHQFAPLGCHKKVESDLISWCQKMGSSVGCRLRILTT